MVLLLLLLLIITITILVIARAGRMREQRAACEVGRNAETSGKLQKKSDTGVEGEMIAGDQSAMVWLLHRSISCAAEKSLRKQLRSWKSLYCS